LVEENADMKKAELANKEMARNKAVHDAKIRQAQSYVSVMADSLQTIAGSVKEFAMVARAGAIAEAVMNTYAGANKALASAPPPLNFALAGAVIGAGLINVGKIASTPMSFQTDTGQVRRIPAPSGVPVNIQAHGQEIIGRDIGGFGGGSLIVNGNIFDMGETISELRDGFFNRSKMDGLPLSATV